MEIIPPFNISPLYAGCLGIIFFTLSINVIRLRWKHKVSLGHANESELEKAIRAHGNFAEYAPFALVLIAFMELRALNPILIHVCGISLLIGRSLHVWGVLKKRAPNLERVAGMVLTLGSIVLASFLLFVTTLR